MINYFNQLSIDQSTKNTGWCIFKNGMYHSSGVFCPEGSSTDERLLEIYNFISGLVNEHSIQVCSLEDIFLKERNEGYKNYLKPKGWGDNVLTHKVLGELMGTCKMALYSNNPLRVTSIPPVSWKAYLNMLGKGTEGKQKELSVVIAKRIIDYKKEIKDDNEADAICMAHYFNRRIYDMNEALKKNEYKIEGFPTIFAFMDKKKYNELSRARDIKITKTIKCIIGKNPNGKNKWGTKEEEFYCDEIPSLNKELKLQFLEKLKDKVGFKSELAEKVWNKEYEFVKGGK